MSTTGILFIIRTAATARRPRALLAGAIIVVAIAACGGARHAERPASSTVTAPMHRVRSPLVRALIRDYRRLDADVRALRAAAAKVNGGTLHGTPALRRLTGGFIEDLERSKLSPKARNRMIVHAAGAVATSCEQCFQQLEAVRPIPQIAGH